MFEFYIKEWCVGMFPMFSMNRVGVRSSACVPCGNPIPPEGIGRDVKTPGV
jgi:hypothetical protein